MIVFKTREIPEDRPNMPCSAFRKVLEIAFNSVEWVPQFKRNGEWHSSHAGIKGIRFRLSLQFGSTHIYYDGPHCIYEFGPIIIHWDRWGCKKCREDTRRAPHRNDESGKNCCGGC